MKSFSSDKLLKREHLKCTPVRVAVLHLLATADAALSASELEHQADADRITIYRTLKTFEEKGLIHRVTDADGQQKYAFCGEGCTGKQHNHEHAHFSCSACGITICVPEAKVPPLVLPKGYEVVTVHLTLAGNCPACSQTQSR